MRIRNYKNIYQITFLSMLFPINCYLVEEDSNLTLIDIGLKSFCEPVLNLSKKIGKPISNIILTHPHSDHIGGLDKLNEKLPNATVYISKRDSLLMNGDFSLEENEPSSKINGGFIDVNIKADVLLNDGDYIGSLKAISTPGHTPGSMSFYNEELRILITGDAFQVKGGLSVSGDKRLFFPFPALATWSKEIAIESAKKLSKLEINLLATGHGDVIESPKELIINAIKRAEKNLKGGSSIWKKELQEI